MANKYTFIMILKEFVNQTKKNIINLTKEKLNNEDKKEKLDTIIEKWLDNLLLGAKLNFVTKFLIKNYVIKNIPILTQIVYDLIKSKIDGVTK